MRLGKYQEMVQRYLASYVNTEFLSVIFSIFKVVAMFAWINHLIACAWYGIAVGNFAEQNWLEVYSMDMHSLEEKYAISYHWSLTLFSGIMEVVPQSHIERTFNVIVCIFAFFASCWIVSLITSEMTHLEIVSATASKQLNALHKYLNANDISQTTCLQILRCVKNAMRFESLHPSESSVKLLTSVSQPLMVVLHFEMHMKLLSMHPFLNEFAFSDAGVMKEVTHSAISCLLLSPGEILFCVGEVQTTPCMYFVRSGQLEYQKESQSEEVDANSPETLDAGSWFCEPSLWTPWEHFGTMIAVRECDILVLSSEAFVRIVVNSETHGLPAYKYGYRFLELLNHLPDEEISDLPIPSMKLEAITLEVFHGDSQEDMEAETHDTSHSK
jgi:hypothetical protein